MYIYGAQNFFNDVLVCQNIFSVFYGPQAKKVWETLI